MKEQENLSPKENELLVKALKIVIILFFALIGFFIGFAVGSFLINCF